MIVAAMMAAALARGAVDAGALDRASRRLAIPAPELAAFVAAGERVGTPPVTVLNGLFSVGSRAHEASAGRDLEAAAAQSQLGLTLQMQDGVPEVGDYVLALAAVVRHQRDPYTQARVCDLLGCTELLPIFIDTDPSALKGR